MSNASPLESDSAVPQRSVDVQSLRQLCLPALRFAGFWTAVLLPFVLASLLVGGYVSQFPQLVGGLLALNFVGLVLGRNHNR
jgi:hypothetical protein